MESTSKDTKYIQQSSTTPVFMILYDSFNYMATPIHLRQLAAEPYGSV